MKRNKKGFTVLELIIVIGLMGLLTSMIVPLFGDLSFKRNNASDRSMIKSLNNALSLEETIADTTNITMSDALSALSKRGYDVSNLRSHTKDLILWNEKDNRFVMESEKDNHVKDVDYWIISNTYDENNQRYSIYADENFNIENINNLKTGFDVGNNLNIKSISYIRKDEEAQNAKIITNKGVELYIDAPNDVIRHYGEAKSVNIEAVAHSSYHEYGKVEEASLKSGRFILEKTSNVSSLNMEGKDVVLGSTLKRLLPDLTVNGIRYMPLQINGHHHGVILSETTAYIDNDGHILLSNAQTGDKIETTTDEEEIIKDKDIVVDQLSDSEILTLNLKNKANFNLNLSGDITYKNETYNLSGTVIINNDEFEDISYDASIALNLGFKIINLRIVRILDDYYVTYNNYHYYLQSASLNEVIHMINEISSTIQLPEDLFNLASTLLNQKFSGMASVASEENITYTCRLLEDMNPIVLTSDLDYNLTSISINDLEDKDFKVNLRMDVNSLGTGKLEFEVPTSYLSIDLMSLSSDTRNGIVNTFKNMLNNHSTGMNYDINVSRNNDLTFSTSGRLDVEVDEDNGEKDISLALSGNMINQFSDAPLNATYDIKYLNDNVYFSYQDRLKLSYTKAGLEGLIDIIKTRLTDSEIFQKFADAFMPDNSSEDAPLFDILFSSQNFKELLSYFKNFSKDGNDLVVHFDPSLMNSTSGDITFKIKTNNNGLGEIILNNLYVYGYTLNGSFSFSNYQEVTVNNVNSYTKLDYINNSLDSLLSIFNNKKVALTVNGSINKGSETTSFTGSTQFALTDTQNWGVGKINITDKNNRNHNVVIDVTNTHVDINASEEEKNNAFASSKVLFNYNNNLKGKFTLKSVMEVYELISNLASNNDSRFEKYKEYLVEDISRSTIARLLKDEIESILYNDMITSISLSGNTYTIKVNGNFLKKNNLYQCDYIYIDVRMNNDHSLKGITIRSDKVLDYNFTISFDIATWNSNYTRLTETNDYYDFSDLKTLSEYLLNTAKHNDYHVNGTLNIDMSLFNASWLTWDYEDISMEAYVHIEEDNLGNEKVYSQVAISVPWKSSTLNKSKKWDGRMFYIYFTDREVYLNTTTWKESDHKSKTCYSVGKKKIIGVEWNNWQKKITTWDQRDYTYQDIKLSMEQFFDNALYYIFNFGFDIDKDLSSYGGSNDNVDYSKILKGYSYTSNGKPKWDVTINMEELTGQDHIGDLNLSITGNTSTKHVDTLKANIDVDILNFIYIKCDLNASLDHTTTPVNLVNGIKSYLSSHSHQTNKSVYNSTSVSKYNVNVEYKGTEWGIATPAGYTKE